LERKRVKRRGWVILDRVRKRKPAPYEFEASNIRRCCQRSDYDTSRKNINDLSLRSQAPSGNWYNFFHLLGACRVEGTG
jgi:hypothetical protein